MPPIGIASSMIATGTTIILLWIWSERKDRPRHFMEAFYPVFFLAILPQLLLWGGWFLHR